MKARILVIDDEPAIRDTLRMILEYAGHEMIGAGSGPEGLGLVEREAPALVRACERMDQTGEQAAGVVALMRQRGCAEHCQRGAWKK